MKVKPGPRVKLPGPGFLFAFLDNPMMTFREFLEATQRMLFSTGPRELYHGTVTGRDDSNLKGFREKGAMSSMSGGYGQGGGFFVYTDRSSARKQAVGISTGRGASYRGNMDNLGDPMVVTVEAVMEPEEWDIDYELNHKAVMDYLIKNFERVKDKLQSDAISVEKVTMGLRPWERPDHYKQKREDPHPLSVGPSKDDELQLEPVENWLPDSVKAEIDKRPTGFRISAKGARPLRTQLGPARNREVWHYGDRQEKGGLTTDGESIGIIMNMLQKNDPRIVHSFEELFFANMGPGIAVKYVGQRPLKAKSIEIIRTDGNPMMNQAVDDSYWQSA